MSLRVRVEDDDDWSVSEVKYVGGLDIAETSDGRTDRTVPAHSLVLKHVKVIFTHYWIQTRPHLPMV